MDRTFRPRSGRFPAIFGRCLHFEIKTICQYWPLLRNFKDFLCSKVDCGQKLFQIHNQWVSGTSLDPKDVLYRFWHHSRKSQIWDFVNFWSCYTVSYPDNYLTCVKKFNLLYILQSTVNFTFYKLVRIIGLMKIGGRGILP